MTSSRPIKAPSIGSNTKLLSFDLETNGLHGSAFAVGAVVMGADGKVHGQFEGRCLLDGKADPWVKDNVLPVVADMPLNCKNSRELREAFWQWYLRAEPEADYVVVNNGYPVEYRFLLQCQEENLDERYWQHPFPILDLFSLLVQVGQKGDKSKLMSAIKKREKLVPHHPLHDAKLAALAAFEAFRLSGQLKES